MTKNNIPIFKFALSEELLENCKEKEIDYNKFLPARLDIGASGWDVRCAAPGGMDIYPEEYIKVPLGFRVFSPKGWWLELNPRSSTFIKKYIHSLYGKIDSSFEGHLFFCGQYLPDRREIITSHPRKIKFGERIAQIMPVKLKVMDVENISNEEYDLLCKKRNYSRGSGGFGSTDIKEKKYGIINR